MAILHRNGHHLYYEVHGSGDTILGIHGSPSSAVFWEDAAPELARLGRCVIYDRQGYHRSAWEHPRDRVDLDDQLDDAAALLDGLDGAPAVVVGRSTGGQIALALAVRRPELVRALVLLEPAVFTLVPEAAAWAGELRAKVLKAAEQDPSAASRAVLEEALGADTWAGFPAEVQELFTAGATGMLAEMAGDGLDLSLSAFAPDAEELHAVRQPTLVLSGASSYPWARAVDDRLVAALPDARHEVVPGGHLIHPAHPAVLDFVAQVLRAADPGQP
jgi:pimeloyl-ACP methyl ester carboxylesterase